MEDVADAAVREDWVRIRNMLVFPLAGPVNPLRPVDVFPGEPVAFQALSRDVVRKDLDGSRIPVASIDHLIQSKRQSGRARDAEDIGKLMQIRLPGTGGRT